MQGTYIRTREICTAKGQKLIRVTPCLHRRYYLYGMDRQVTRDIRRMYHYSKKKMVFISTFEKELTEYIRRRCCDGSVDFNKLNFEFKTLKRKCRKEDKKTSYYLGKVAELALLCLHGHHRHVVLEKKSLEFKKA